MEHTENDASGCVKKAVEKGTVLKKKVTEPFINGKNAVTMGTLDLFKSHGIGSVLAVFDTTGWTKPAFTAERNKYEISAFGTGIHCPTESRVAVILCKRY